MSADSIIRIPRDFNAELERIRRRYRELVPDAPPSIYGETTPAQERETFPMPEEAPQVPPLEKVRAILNDPLLQPPELAQQVCDSINCRRARDWLLMEDIDQGAEGDQQGGTDVGIVPEFVQELLADSPTPGASGGVVSPWENYLDQKSEENGGQNSKNPKKGEVWSTSDQLDGPDGKVFMYLPPTVLVVDSSAGLVVRVIPCSPADCWSGEHGGRFDIEIPVAGYMPLVAHLWLETHVSSSQLVKPVGGMESGWSAVTEGQKQLDAPGTNLDQLLEAYEEGMDDMTLVQRRQVEACARYLACNLTGESERKG